MSVSTSFLSNDGVTKWLASAGLVGTNVAGRLGHVAG